MPKRIIRILGSPNLQNDLLSRFLEHEAELNATCSISPQWTKSILASPGAPDLILLDFQNPEWEQICRQLGELESGSVEPVFAIFNIPPKEMKAVLTQERLHLGLRGIFSEEELQEQIACGISAIFEGDWWIPRNMLGALLINSQPKTSPCPDKISSLTDREKEILRIIASGSCNKDIADQLGISPHTVRTHIHNLFAKIGVTSRLQAALWFNQNLKTESFSPKKPNFSSN